MRIAAITIRNYRCLKDVSLDIEKYGVFIGANGAGKSSVLYALDWFFNGTTLTNNDIHGYEEGQALPPGSTIEVRVSFADLTAKDRERLQQYGRGDRAEIRRTWYPDGKVKTVGNAQQGPGFAAVRAETGAAERRAKYRDLQTSLTGLPELPGNASKEAILKALALWELDPANVNHLEEIADADATEMMGWHGPNVLRECVRFVLVPAATSIVGEVGSATRGTALTELVGAIMSEASTRAQQAWLHKHADAVTELTVNIRSSIEGATGVQASRINARLASFVPNARVVLTPSVPEFAPKVTPSIATAITIEGFTNDVSRQGNGIQRAVMISMFQAMVPDADLTRTTHFSQEGEDELEAQARLEQSLSALPSIIVAIEEPEIYQHPIRARSFARTLVELSKQTGVQVLLATHSPYFVHPEQFAALHRFTHAGGRTSVANATIATVAASSGFASEQVEKAILSSVPTEFSEGFFADAVALVEGQTDRVVIEATAAKLGQDLDRLGVSILSVKGKGGLPVARAILTALGIPTYVVADGDFGTSSRKVYPDKTPEKAAALRDQAHGNHRSATENLVTTLPRTTAVTQGTLPYAFGNPTVVCDSFTIWRDDIEEELEAWTSFTTALSAEGITLSARNDKNLLTYRNAVAAANSEDVPEVIKAVVSALCALAGRDGSSEIAAAGELTED